MVFFVLFLSVFIVLLVIFFAFYPIKITSFHVKRRKPRYSETLEVEEIFDDDEL